MVLEDFNLSAWSLEVAQWFTAMTAEPGPTDLQPDRWGGVGRITHWMWCLPWGTGVMFSFLFGQFQSLQCKIP